MEQRMQASENKKTFYVVLIIILIILNVFFAYNNWSARQQVQQIEAQRNELDSLYTGVLSELTSSQLRLDSLSGFNSQLDSMLLARVKELEASKKEIEGLLKENKLTASQLSEARRLIKSLKSDNKKYIAQIDSLSTQVVFLTTLSDSLAVGLQTEKAENEKLRSESVILSNKVALASLLKPENVVASGVRYKSNDREITTNKAKKSEKLKICFDVPDNKVADPGSKTLLLRILNPQGATVAVNSEGSGVFEVAETGEQKQFTTMAQFDYQNAAKNVCVVWSQTAPYGNGIYKVIFYQDGYFLKESEFELK